VRCQCGSYTENIDNTAYHIRGNRLRKKRIDKVVEDVGWRSSISEAEERAIVSKLWRELVEWKFI